MSNQQPSCRHLTDASWCDDVGVDVQQHHHHAVDLPAPLHSTLMYPLNSTTTCTCTTRTQTVTGTQPPGIGQQAEKNIHVHKANYCASTKNNLKRKMKMYRRQLRKHGLISFHVLAVL